MKKVFASAMAGIVAVALAAFSTASASAATTQVGTVSGFGGYQYGAAVSPDGNIHAVSDTEHSAVNFVYQDTQQHVIIYDPGADIRSPWGMVFSPDGSTLFVANNARASVVIIDVATATVTGTFGTSNSGNTEIGITVDGTKLMVANNNADDITVFSVGGLYSPVGAAPTGPKTVRILPVDASTVYIVDGSGDVRTYDPTNDMISWPVNPGIVDVFGVTSSCAMPDFSALVMTTSNVVYFVDPVTGSQLGTINIKNSDASQNNNAFCVTTPDGHVVVTDWGRGFDPSGAGYIYVLDGIAYSYIETVELTGAASAGGITLNNDCQVFVDGYFGGVAIAQLEASYCVAPTSADAAPNPELPTTGVDTTALAVAAGIALALIILGSVVVVGLRRH